MRWRLVAHHLVFVTGDNRSKQLGTPEASIGLRCGTLKHKGSSLVSHPSSFRGRLHGAQKGKQAIPQSSRIACGNPKYSSHGQNNNQTINPHFILVGYLLQPFRLTIKGPVTKCDNLTEAPSANEWVVRNAEGNIYNIKCTT